jgi:hypothetical protein
VPKVRRRYRWRHLETTQAAVGADGDVGSEISGASPDVGRRYRADEALLQQRSLVRDR